MGIAVLASTAADAATLSAIQGEVLVSRGGAYQAVSGSTELAPGDSVIVNPGGSAQVVYENGVSVPVQPGAVVTVDAVPPTAAPGALAETPPLTGEGATLGGLDTTTLVVGGVVAAGAAGAVVALSNSKPASGQ